MFNVIHYYEEEHKCVYLSCTGTSGVTPCKGEGYCAIAEIVRAGCVVYTHMPAQTITQTHTYRHTHTRTQQQTHTHTHTRDPLNSCSQTCSKLPYFVIDKTAIDSPGSLVEKENLINTDKNVYIDIEVYRIPIIAFMINL